MRPTVSILIPCYNAEPWVAQAIRSALDQTYAEKEVIVIDDGSQDRSLSIIRQFSDRVRFETGSNRGGNVARNRLIQISNGEWLSFLDADDFLLPQKIEKQIEFIAERPELDVVYAPAFEIGDDPSCMRSVAVDDDDLFANYFRWCAFSTNSLLLRKSAIMDVGGWKKDQPVCQEHELILRLMLANKSFGMFPESLVVNRIHSKPSVSRRSPLKTIEQRMTLSSTLECYLLSNGKLNEVRKHSLAQARFECARSVYPYDRKFAKSLMAMALASMESERFKNANPLYGACLCLGGMEFAEGLASCGAGSSEDLRDGHDGRRPLPLFSVIIPSYNRAKYITDTLRSIDCQEFRDFEVIVVDDGSTDDTLERLETFRDRVELLRQENKGPGPARNLGVQHSSGEYIAFVDSDDLWFPWTLATYARIIAERGRPTLIAGRLWYFQHDEELKEHPKEPFDIETFPDYLSASGRGLYCGTCQMAVRRDSLLAVGGFSEANINSEDHDLVMRLGTKAGFVNVVTPAMVAYRQHPEAATRDVSKTVAGVLNLLETESAGGYPGGKKRVRERRRILTRHVRPLTFELIRQKNSTAAWDLYRRTFFWNLSLGRLPYLVAFCVKACVM